MSDEQGWQWQGTGVGTKQARSKMKVHELWRAILMEERDWLAQTLSVLEGSPGLPSAGGSNEMRKQSLNSQWDGAASPWSVGPETDPWGEPLDLANAQF